jgi:hypothetical protein
VGGFRRPERSGASPTRAAPARFWWIGLCGDGARLPPETALAHPCERRARPACSAEGGKGSHAAFALVMMGRPSISAPRIEAVVPGVAMLTEGHGAAPKSSISTRPASACTTTSA